MSLLREFSCAHTGAPFALRNEPIGSDGARELVRAAVLAANAHNSQPWRFTASHGMIDVHADLDRHLGSFDPFRREMHQSLGCAIENIVHAARAQSLKVDVEMFPAKLPPNGDDDLAARVRLSPAPAWQSELFRAIPRRHTHRGAYDTDRKLPTSMMTDLMALTDHPRVRLFLFDGDACQAELGELILQSTRQIVADCEMAADNAKWFRFSVEDVRHLRDGLTLGANVPSPLMAATARLFPPNDAAANKSWVGSTKKQIETAALFGIIAVPDAHERALAVEAGRLWQRLHLLFTARGIAAQPLNEPVERADRERALGLGPRVAETLARITGEAGSEVAFIFRAGYPKHEACLSPRRPLEDVIAKDGARKSGLNVTGLE